MGNSLIESTSREGGAGNAEPDSGAAEQRPTQPNVADEAAEMADAAVAQEPGHTDSNSTATEDDTNEDQFPVPGPLCGNGILDTDEECDDGRDNGVAGSECTDLCKDDKCGDGHVGPVEDCDDGNRMDGDSCTNECQAPFTCNHCGDGFADSCEDCDEGLDNGSVDSFCTDKCILAVCGDGMRNNGEECDEGAENGSALSTCSAECTPKLPSSTPPSCGDGNRDPEEECDDGNLNGVAGSACTAVCSYDVCGDAHVGPVEECDDGNAVDDDSCTNVCSEPLPPPLCGDGVLDPGESCDFGAENGTPGSTCTVICQLDVCGDGHRGREETCDDGNRIDDDTCPNTCRLERDAGSEPSFDAGLLDAGDAG